MMKNRISLLHRMLTIKHWKKFCLIQTIKNRFADYDVLYNTQVPLAKINYNWSSTRQDACLDTGAERTLAGCNQAKANCHFVGITLKPIRCWKLLHFGSDQQKLIGSIAVRSLNSNQNVMVQDVNILTQNIPILIAIDAFSQLNMYVETFRNKLPYLRIEGVLVRKSEHIYSEWN